MFQRLPQPVKAARKVAGASDLSARRVLLIACLSLTRAAQAVELPSRSFSYPLSKQEAKQLLESTEGKGPTACRPAGLSLKDIDRWDKFACTEKGVCALDPVQLQGVNPISWYAAPSFS